MFRLIFWLLGLLVAISVIRAIVGILFKGLGDLFSTQPNQPTQNRAANKVPLTGELKKDPVCGTYISAATSLQEKVGGEIHYFCSKECRDKYVASLAR